MKKAICKIIVFILIFIIALAVSSKIMNQDNDNLTMEMASAAFPVITMETQASFDPVASIEGRNTDSSEAAASGEEDGDQTENKGTDISYNQLHGYRNAMNTAFQRETVTELSENRELSFKVDTYGLIVEGIGIEVRSLDGSRLIESSQVTKITESTAASGWNAGNKQLKADIALKDLIEADTEYMLVILLDTQEEGTIRYYTRIIWSQNTHMSEKLTFVKEFHELLYDRETAREKNLAKYLESNSTGDNTTFHKVNIHSSFTQITWGELNVTEAAEPVIQVTEVGSQTGTIVLHYMVFTSQDKDITYYQVEEVYRVRYLTNADRMYLLDYERTMTQIPDVDGDIYSNDKILLGIVDENLPFAESEDGNIVIFQVADCLYSYNVTTNKAVVLFGFYDKENADDRTLYWQHGMKLLDVDEGGNVRFAVYGYMNRGRHEGEVGIQIYNYNNAQNTIEEIIYIPSEKSYDVLACEMEQLLFLNRDDQLYLYLENTVFQVDIAEKTCQEMVVITQDNGMMASSDHKVVVWQEGDGYYGSSLVVKNLNNGTQSRIEAEDGTAIRLLGFMEEDIIYGLAKLEDITVDSAGNVFFPMYKICIRNSSGELLKETSQENVYVTGCSVADNQITLDRVLRTENGAWQETTPDYIMTNETVSTGKNKLVVASIDVYEKYVQIQTRLPIDEKTLQVRRPKEVVFEGGRNLKLQASSVSESYYAYDAYGISGIFLEPARAVQLAYERSGDVTDEQGRLIWKKGNTVTSNQIMAIKADAADEERSSLAVCLDTMLEKEGVVRSAQPSLDQGKSILSVLSEGLENCRILDLTGVSLDAVLYYVNQDIPVLALLEDGEAVLVTGFNQFNVVIMDPVTGTLYKKGIKDSAEWFAQNGNCFITYVYE